MSGKLKNLLNSIKKQYSFLKDKKVVLLYSGGVDTSFLIKIFKEEVGVKELYAVTFDLGGFNKKEISKIIRRAKQLGAIHVYKNAKKDFVPYIQKAIQANAIYYGAHPLSSSLSRPLKSKLVLDIANKHACSAIVHGSTSLQNNAVRFNKSFSFLHKEKNIKIITPLEDIEISRELEYQYLALSNLEIEQNEDNLFSSDCNYWALEGEDGRIRKEAFFQPDEPFFHMTVNPTKALKHPEYLDIYFNKGIPISINKKKYSLLDLIEKLNKIAGKHGVGRYDSMEGRVQGFKEREIHEAPAASVLIEAHKDLERTILTNKELLDKGIADLKWIDKVCFGEWYALSTQKLNVYIESINKKITGTVRMELYKGHTRPVGRIV